jgi:ATP-dependent DNA ligase
LTSWLRCSSAADAWNINAGSAIIDGEVVAPAADGTTDFSVLQNELKGRSKKIVMVAFDLLYFNGYDLQKLPLFERKALLKQIIDKTDIQFSESFEVDGGEMYKHACKTGLEGVVSKVRDSRHVSSRVNDWVKTTCAQRETLAIAGFALDGKRWDGIYLGRRKGKELIYAGKVDHGFDSASEGLAGAAKAADPGNAALRQEDRASWHLGRAVAIGRDRIPSEVSRARCAILSSRASGRTCDLLPAQCAFEAVGILDAEDE